MTEISFSIFYYNIFLTLGIIVSLMLFVILWHDIKRMLADKKNAKTFFNFLKDEKYKYSEKEFKLLEQFLVNYVNNCSYCVKVEISK